MSTLVPNGDGLTATLLLRLLAGSGALQDAPGTGDRLLDLLDRRFLLDGPVIAVDSRAALPARRLSAWSASGRRVFLFPPRSAASMPIPDDPLRPGWDADEVRTHLADRHRDVEITVARDQALLRPELTRLRRIDDLFAALESCAALWVADAPYHFEVLDGAAALIRRTRPILAVELGTLGDAARAEQAVRLAERAALLGYLLYDGDLMPLRTGEECDLAARLGRSSVFVAAPPEAAARLTGLDAGNGLDPLRARLYASLETLARGPGAFQLAPGPMAIRCDDSLPARGLYPTESDGKGSWRWSGPGSTVRVLVPVPRPGRYGLAITITGAEPAVLEAVTARIGGTDAAIRVQGDRNWAQLLCAAELPVRGFRGWLDLELRHPPARRRSDSDKRRLGICIGGFELRPAADPI